MSEPVQQLETDLAELSAWITRPRPGECLICYLLRMVEEFGCTELRWSKHYRDQRAPRAQGLERRLAGRGGHCDCEVLVNAVRPLFGVPRPGDDDVLAAEEATVIPPCTGVRRGSTQPCLNWRWRRQGEPFDW